MLAGLQRTAPKDTQPAIAAAICLLGVNCEAHRGFLVRSLTFAEDTAGFQSLVRSAAAALAPSPPPAIARQRRALVDVGIPSRTRRARRSPSPRQRWPSGTLRC